MKAIEILFEKIIELSEGLKSDNSIDKKVDITNGILKTAECIMKVEKLRYDASKDGEFV